MSDTQNDEYELIFVKAYWHSKANKLMVAANYGKKAWPIWVKKKKERKKN